ncbi:amidohydrolase family protein [Flagellimonas sp. 2504JD1-5]
MKNHFSLLLILILVIYSCKEEKKSKYDLLILNSTIVDVKTGTLNNGSFIAISNDTIRLIGKMNDMSMLESKDTIDAANKYVMPGLWDMHVHFRGGDSLIQENKNLLPLFLSHGVTTIRDAGGDMTPSVMKWKNQINNGTLNGPNIFTSGPKLDGQKPTWEGSINIVNSNQIKMALDSLEGIDVDYVKLYNYTLSKEIFYNIIKEAEKRGLKTTGHVPKSANVIEAIEYGFDGEEHMFSTLQACSKMVKGELKFDSKSAAEVYAKMASQDFYITPTLNIQKILIEILDTDHADDEILAYIGEGIQETYQMRIDRAIKNKAEGSDLGAKTLMQFVEMIVPMYQAGINVLAGSDCGPFNSYNYPGESLHGELIMLVEAGLTPQQALECSIVNGPKFFGLENFYGSIENNKVADLILLNKNPLQNIKNIEEINIVINKGKIFDGKSISQMLRLLKN